MMMIMMATKKMMMTVILPGGHFCSEYISLLTTIVMRIMTNLRMMSLSFVIILPGHCMS